MAVLLPIKSCKNCPFWKETPYPTEDSWERPSYWWCTNESVVENDENVKEHDKWHIEMMRNHFEKVRKIAGYVEWMDEKHIEIPEWCPLEKK